MDKSYIKLLEEELLELEVEHNQAVIKKLELSNELSKVDSKISGMVGQMDTLRFSINNHRINSSR